MVDFVKDRMNTVILSICTKMWKICKLFTNINVLIQWWIFAIILLMNLMKQDPEAMKAAAEGQAGAQGGEAGAQGA